MQCRVASVLLALDAVAVAEGRIGGRVVDDLLDPAVADQLGLSRRDMSAGLSRLLAAGAIRLAEDGSVLLANLSALEQLAWAD